MTTSFNITQKIIDMFLFFFIELINDWKNIKKYFNNYILKYLDKNIRAELIFIFIQFNFLRI
jgi:hypothetical protein